MAAGRRQEEGDAAVDRANSSRGAWGQPGPGSELFYGGAARLHPRAGPAPSSHPSLALLAARELFWSRDSTLNPAGGPCEVTRGRWSPPSQGTSAEAPVSSCHPKTCPREPLCCQEPGKGTGGRGQGEGGHGASRRAQPTLCPWPRRAQGQVKFPQHTGLLLVLEPIQRHRGLCTRRHQPRTSVPANRTCYFEVSAGVWSPCWSPRDSALALLSPGSVHYGHASVSQHLPGGCSGRLSGVGGSAGAALAAIAPAPGLTGRAALRFTLILPGELAQRPGPAPVNKAQHQLSSQRETKHLTGKPLNGSRK